MHVADCPYFPAGQQLSGWNSFLYYSSTLFGAAGFNNTSAIGIMVAGINCIFTIVSMLTMDRLGRRRYFLIGVPIMSISLAVSAGAFYKMTIPTGGQLLDGQDYEKKWIALMLTASEFPLPLSPFLPFPILTTFPLQCALSSSVTLPPSVLSPTLPLSSFLSRFAVSDRPLPLLVNGCVFFSLAPLLRLLTLFSLQAGNLIISATFLTMLKSLGAAGTYGLFSGFCFVRLSSSSYRARSALT
jgi:hypothetical protein